MAFQVGGSIMGPVLTGPFPRAGNLYFDLAGQKPELKDGKTGTINISFGIRFAYRLY